MRRFAAAVLIALSGCASATTYVAPSVRVSASAVDLAQTQACVKGSQACIDSVVAEMKQRYDRLAAACDHRAAFALMYLRVTEGVKQPDARRFRDARYLHRLDALFARHYFRAFDAYGSGRPTAPAWRIAFESARRGQTTALGDMLLGMNAHISNDLPFAAVEAGVSASAREDFDAVNDLLGDVQSAMVRDESRLLDPTVATTTLPYLGIRGGSDIATVIAGWRSEAWQNARRLVAAPTADARAKQARRIRAAAAERAQIIQALGSNRLLGGDARKRDAYCRTRGAGA